MHIARITTSDAPKLCEFYNRLSADSKRTFRPLGETTTVEDCEPIIRANHGACETKLDLLIWQGASVVGWGFVWDTDTEEPMLGIAIADAFQGMGLGTKLAAHLMRCVHDMSLERVVLTVVVDNEKAQSLYRGIGFKICGSFHHDEDGLDYYRMVAEYPYF